MPKTKSTKQSEASWPVDLATGRRVDPATYRGPNGERLITVEQMKALSLFHSTMEGLLEILEAPVPKSRLREYGRALDRIVRELDRRSKDRSSRSRSSRQRRTSGVSSPGTLRSKP